MAALYATNSGIPHREQTFWQSHSVEQIISLLHFNCNFRQSVKYAPGTSWIKFLLKQVFNYLKQFIGNVNQAEVRRLLWLTTGSSVIVSGGITVTFNNLSGIACRPIAHTCDCCLELPSTYTSYLDFEEEFNAVLADDHYAWQMDSVWLV